MLPTDRKRFALCLVGIAELYGKPTSDAVIALWWNALKLFDLEAVDNAFRHHVQSPDIGQFMPKPADILRSLQGTSTDAAMIAWAKVDNAVRRVGPYATVVFDDSLIHRVLEDMGGWIPLGNKNEDEWPFVGNEFRNRYTGYRSRAEKPDYLAKLPGISERDTLANGFPYDAFTLVGDKALAVNVLLKGRSQPALQFHRAALALPQPA